MHSLFCIDCTCDEVAGSSIIRRAKIAEGEQDWRGQRKLAAEVSWRQHVTWDFDTIQNHRVTWYWLLLGRLSWHPSRMTASLRLARGRRCHGYAASVVAFQGISCCSSPAASTHQQQDQSDCLDGDYGPLRNRLYVPSHGMSQGQMGSSRAVAAVSVWFCSACFGTRS